MADDDLHSIAREPNEIVRIERLAHNIERIRDGLDELRRGQAELRASMKQMADALTRLTLVEERQSSTSSAIERLAVSIDKLDERLRHLELAEQTQAKTTAWVQAALWALAAAAAIFIAKKVGLI